MGESTCSVADCDLASAKLGMCKLHYDQQLRATAAPCLAEDCERRSRCRGLCNMHYHRSRSKPSAFPQPPWELPGEHWLPIAGYEGAYEVSDLGRVRGLDREMVAADGVLQSRRGRVLQTSRMRSGHMQASLWSNNVATLIYVHRLVLLTFIGPPPPDMECCHNNGDPADNRLINLRWASHLDNMDDKRRHGTHHNTIKTACSQGHLLQHPNLKRWNLEVKGHRRCLACDRARTAQYEAKLAGRPFDFSAVVAHKYAEIMEGNADETPRPTRRRTS